MSDNRLTWLSDHDHAELELIEVDADGLLARLRFPVTSPNIIWDVGLRGTNLVQFRKDLKAVHSTYHGSASLSDENHFCATWTIRDKSRGIVNVDIEITGFFFGSTPGGVETRISLSNLEINQSRLPSILEDCSRILNEIERMERLNINEPWRGPIHE